MQMMKNITKPFNLENPPIYILSRNLSKINLPPKIVRCTAIGWNKWQCIFLLVSFGVLDILALYDCLAKIRWIYMQFFTLYASFK